MPLAGDKYYVQGFCLDKRKTSVTFVQSLFENSISVENKVIVTFKPGAKSSDFTNLLPYGITIVNDRTLTQQRITKLIPNKIKLNTHAFECYDIENRVVNYLVTWDRESLLVEDAHHTAFVINQMDAKDITKLKPLLDSSKYIKFLSYPIDEFYSYPMVNTHASDALLATKPVDGCGGTGSGSGNGGAVIGNEIQINSHNNSPMYLSKYTQYRLEYSKVLLSFYDQLELQLPGFTLYSGSTKIGEGDQMDSDRITINLEGLGNLERRPYMNDLDLLDEIAILNLKIQTSDHLKYMHIKNSYQNLTILSNLARFNTKDIYDLDWLTHIEWEPFVDNIRMKEVRDEGGRFSYTLDIRCSLYYYIVKDKMYPFIKWIDTNYVTLNNGKGINLTVI